MSDTSSVPRWWRSRPIWFWIYASVSAVVMLTLMVVIADRVTGPTTSFEPITTETSGTAVPENEFLPEDRPLSDCISAIPKPGCGSEARGGWRQGLVLLAVLVGLTMIAWRVVVTARRARSEAVDTA